MRKLRIGVLGSTRGTSLQTVIDAIAARELFAEIVMIVSNKKEAGILQRAQDHHIPSRFIDPKAYESREAFDESIFHVLETVRVDLVVLVGFMRILSKPFIDSYPRAIINVHPSLLPRHAGLMDLDVHQAVLDAGESESGCSVHFVDEGIDTGDVIIQKTCPVFSKDSAESLKSRVQPLEGFALVEAIELLQQQGLYHE